MTQTSSVQVGGFSVPYRLMGEGPPILCSELPLNPFALFAPLQTRLAGRFSVFLIDLRPVVGYSDRKPPAGDLLDFLSDFSLRVMDALGIRECSLMGSFMFGAVSMDMARKAPSRVENLVLLGPLGTIRVPKTPLLRFITGFYRLPAFPFFFRFPAFRSLVEWTDRSILGPRRMYEIFYDPKKVSARLEDLYEQYKIPRNTSAALALMWLIRRMNYTKLVSSLHEVRCRALIICGAEDRWIPFRYVKALQARLPDSTLVLIPKARHAPELECAEETYRSIGAFLKETRETVALPHK